MRRILCLLPIQAGFALALLLPVKIHSQVVGGTVTGMIVPISGDVVPDVQISIRNVATGVTTVVTTNSEGIYNAPNLLPAVYDITVSAPGFQTEVETGVTLTVGAKEVLNLALNPGAATQIQRRATDPAVQLASSDISAVVDSATILELPLNGRSWTDLADLQPGVNAILDMATISSPDRLGRGLGTQLTITGARLSRTIISSTASA